MASGEFGHGGPVSDDFERAMSERNILIDKAQMFQGALNELSYALIDLRTSRRPTQSGRDIDGLVTGLQEGLRDGLVGKPLMAQVVGRPGRYFVERTDRDHLVTRHTPRNFTHLSAYGLATDVEKLKIPSGEEVILLGLNALYGAEDPEVHEYYAYAEETHRISFDQYLHPLSIHKYSTDTNKRIWLPVEDLLSPRFQFEYLDAQLADMRLMKGAVRRMLQRPE